MDEYLKIVLEQIRCKKARPYIRQELQDHIEDQIEANISAGLNRTDAEKEAVKDMGDPVEAGLSLDRIHKPQIAWKLLLIISTISVIGILIHMAIDLYVTGDGTAMTPRYAFHVITGIVVMMILYFLDYTLLARFSKIIAAILIAMCFSTLLFGNVINGMHYFISSGLFGGFRIPIQALMLLYIPIYGGILYKYRGTGYAGLVKSLLWMIIPAWLVLYLPSVMTAGLMLVSMLVMLTIAVRKGWFHVQKALSLCTIWSIFTIAPVVLILVLYWQQRFSPYQMARLQAMFSSGSENYMQLILQDFLSSSNFVGNNGMNIAEALPGFYSDYILTCLTSMYGILPAILLCCILAALVFGIFSTAIRQKNQLGMLMGCGCGMVFLMSLLINVLENIGIFPSTVTFLPFISSGGSYIIACYGLLGIVLSVYRYKNVYPAHIKVKILNS